MSLSANARLVLDAGPLAACVRQSPETKRLILRAAVRLGVRWIYCPDPEAERLAGQSLYDLQTWRAAVRLTPGEGTMHALNRLRRSRIGLAILPAGGARRDGQIDACAASLREGIAQEAGFDPVIVAPARCSDLARALAGTADRVQRVHGRYHGELSEAA
jgi:hypothetical protein